MGVTEKYISIVENNYRKPSLVFYRDVANYFKVSFD
ncbi:MAG: helix-turn-helix transcriptional regulator, partial [Lachnospiraceae bacterium]|nr:helix-turn-helix transcriptional regulator [Lachnospiraceae bacterium]